MIEKNPFKEGYEFFEKNNGILVGTYCGAKYIHSVEDAIKKFQDDLINRASDYANLPNDKLKGFIAEVWHKNTYNIKATVRNTKYRATMPKSTDFASPDIEVSDGQKYSSKYYATAQQSVMEQAKSYWRRFNEDMAKRRAKGLPEINFEEWLKKRGLSSDEIDKFCSIYTGQGRIIPTEQLKAALELLKKKIAKEQMNRPELVAGYEETLKKLQDKIQTADGTASIPLSKEDAEKLAQMAKDGNVDLSQFGITTENLVDFVSIMKDSMKAGVTAAIITTVLKLAPEIYKSIDYLIKNGKIEREHFEAMGFSALSGGAQGFLNGTIAAALTSACKAGLLGAGLKSVDPSIIGTIVVITSNTIIDSYRLAAHKITKGEFINNLAKSIFVATCSIALGLAIQTLTPELPVLGFMIGSFIGSLGATFLYDQGHKILMSICRDTGFTCFGLVEQDYSVPKEVLEDLGIKIFNFAEFMPIPFEYKRFEFKRFEPKKFKYEKLNITILSRDIIAVDKIGYVLK